MIAELFAWARLDCLPVAQALGYRREAAALQVRHRRLRGPWADHLAHTRAALLDGARAARASAQPPERAWIMGAGLLEDIPLEALLDQFRCIDLVDVAFAPAARAAARRHPGRVACVALDVTGVLGDPGRDPLSAAPALPPDVWCASVNILSQLPLLPCAALLRRGLPEAEVERYGRSLQRAHVAALERATHACLVIEYAQTHPPPGPADEVLLPRLPKHLAARGWSRLSQWHWPLNPAGETATPEGRAMQAWSRGPGESIRQGSATDSR